MKAPRRRDPRDDAVNLANDRRAVLGLAPYRLPSAIVAVEPEPEPPEPYMHRHHGLIDTCRPPGYWWRWWHGVRPGSIWQCSTCGGRWTWKSACDSVCCFAWRKTNLLDFAADHVP